MKVRESWAFLFFASLLFISYPAHTEQQRQTLSHHVRAEVLNGKAKPAGDLPSSHRLNLAIVLPLRNQAELQSLLGRLYDSRSPEFHHYLSVEEFTNRFGPSIADYDAVVEYARKNGFTITATSANRMVVSVSATVEQVQQAFHVGMKLYQHPTENRTFYSPDREPSLALSAPVAHIAGLNNFSIPRPMLVKPSAVTKAASAAVQGSGPGGAYLSSDIRAAYYGNGALTGDGQVVCLIQFDGYDINDVVQSFGGTATATANGTDYTVTYTPSSGGTTFTIPIHNILLEGTTGVAASGSDSEQVLDIVQAIGMAPGLSQLRVYVGTTDATILNAIASDNVAKQVSVSWGWLPDDALTIDPFLQEFAAQGQSFFAASGDYGAYSGTMSEYFPAEDAWDTAVGGTTLTTNGAGGSWNSETAWTRSGGGISPDAIPIATWQAGVSNASNQASSTLRNVPDVAMEADTDNFNCNMGACSGGWGGTSFAAPRWAGFMALMNEQAAEAGQPSLGFLNPTIYPLAEGANYGNLFHDIDTGNNGYESGYSFNAVTGYDLVTGWGSPTGQALIDAVFPPSSTGFSLSASPATLQLEPGASGTSTILVHDLAGFSGSVNLSISGLPTGVSATVSPSPTTNSAVLTITTGTNALSGSSLVTVTGTAGGHSAITNVVLDIPTNAVAINSPPMPASSGAAKVLKPGSAVPILATILGVSEGIHVEWASGILPSSGWSSSGMTISTGVSSPLINQQIATWDTSSIVTAGYYTIRVSADYSTGSITASTLVYLEPDLISPNWPMWVSDVPTFASGVVPLTSASGEPLLAWAGNRSPASAFISSVDGSSLTTVPFNSNAGLYNPSAGSLDGQPGDELIATDYGAIDVLRTDGTSYAQFNGVVTDPNAPKFFYAQTTLNDVDGDGLPEVLALEENLLGPGESAYLHAFRGNGQELNANFPISISDQNSNVLVAVPRVLAGDIDGDGNTEIVAIEGASSTTFTPLLFANDGSQRTWAAPTLNGFPHQIMLADLDGNGKLELVMIVNDPSQPQMAIHVLQPDGTERPGWPVQLIAPSWAAGNFNYAFAAVGDLNQNGSKQIIASVGFTIFVLNADGSNFSSAWPLTMPIANASLTLTGSVVVADVNVDGLPEILTTFGSSSYDPLPSTATRTNTHRGIPAIKDANGASISNPQNAIANTPTVPANTLLQNQLVALDRNGQILKSWNLLGANDQQPCWNGTIAVGDFNHSGTTDIAVSYSTVAYQDQNFFYCTDPGVVTVLTTGTRFQPDVNSWPMINHDAQNTGTSSLRAKTSVTLGSSLNPAKVGQQVTFTAAVSPVSSTAKTITGPVVLFDGSQSIGSCQLASGTCSITVTLTAGVHQITAQYMGDNSFASCVSAAITETVNPATNPAATPVFSVPPGTYASSQTVSITDSTTNASIFYTIDGTTPSTNSMPYSGPILVSSSATIEAIATASGYSQSAAATATYTIKITPTVTVSSASSSISNTQSLSVSVSVVAATGSPTPTGTVTLTSGSYTSAATILNGGSATITVPAGSLALGNDTLTVAYSPDSGGSSLYNGASATGSVTVVNATFTMTATGTTVTRGTAGTSTITISSNNGYIGNVSLKCSVSASPVGASAIPTCTVNQTVSLNLSTTSGTTSVTLNTTAATASMNPGLIHPAHLPEAVGGVLALLVLLKPLRRYRQMLLVAFATVLIAGLASCGGGSGNTSPVQPGNPGTTTGNYTITVTGTGDDSAKTSASTTFLVTVN